MYVHYSFRVAPAIQIDAASVLDDKSVLRFPRKLAFQPEPTLRHQIAVHFVARFQEPDQYWPSLAEIKQRLPTEMSRWSKVRVRNGGDSIRGSTGALHVDRERDASYVRVSLCLRASWYGCYLQRLIRSSSSTSRWTGITIVLMPPHGWKGLCDMASCTVCWYAN